MSGMDVDVKGIGTQSCGGMYVDQSSVGQSFGDVEEVDGFVIVPPLYPSSL